MIASPPKSAYELDGYVLGTSFASSSRFAKPDDSRFNILHRERLNLQHYLWKDIVGYNIHPAIPVQDSYNLSIADVGTGTGYYNSNVSSRSISKSSICQDLAYRCQPSIALSSS